MFQVGGVLAVGQPAPLLTNVTDIVGGPSMHQKFKTFSRSHYSLQGEQREKFSTLARVEKIQTEKNCKEFQQPESDQEKSQLIYRAVYFECIICVLDI